MNRVRVHTASGSVYGLDFDLMTWWRLNPERPHIIGMQETSGFLTQRPDIILGQPMTLIGDGRHIRTTAVVSAEVVA